jgi:spermidine/putrescine ABC transporter ATP-binding subunit
MPVWPELPFGGEIMEDNEAKASDNSPEYILIIDDITKKYGKFVAVDQVSLKVERGEFLTLLGPSGSGKSTILMMIAGFQTPTTGKILLNGENILFKPSYKRNIGVAFQNYALFPHMTVFDNIAFPLRMRKMNKQNVKENVERVLEQVELNEFRRRYPKQLSGGQQQRVSLARALVFNPPILLLDEPLGALDKKLRETMQLEIKHLHESIGITMVYVTHDQSEALTMSDRIAVLNHGRIEQLGSPVDLYERPRNKFVADFIGETNLIVDMKPVEYQDDLCKLVSPKGLEILLSQTPTDTADTIHVAIRPERIAFLKSPQEQLNRYEVVVKEVIYLGETLKYKVVTDTRDELTVSVTNEWGTEKYKRGDRVLIGWHEEDLNMV